MQPSEDGVDDPRPVHVRPSEPEPHPHRRGPCDQGMHPRRGAERAYRRPVLHHPYVVDAPHSRAGAVDHTAAEEIGQPHQAPPFVTTINGTVASATSKRRPR